MALFSLIISLLHLANVPVANADDWSVYQTNALGAWSTFKHGESIAWTNYRNEIRKKWGPLATFPERKVYAQYFSDNDVRIRIDYENGRIQIDCLKKDNTQVEVQARPIIQQMIDQGILEKNELPPSAVWSSKTDQFVGGDGQKRKLKTYALNMTADHMEIRARRYLPIILKWANHYQVDPSFVLAVIECESAFNPRARSWVPAFGLMQIVPEYAGAEVLHVVPGEDFLYDPENNIRVGIAYLNLLNQEHFPDIRAGDEKRYLVTCSYNWGPHRIRKAIKTGRLNLSQGAMPLFAELLAIVPRETQGYLRGVSSSYRKWNRYRLGGRTM